MKILSIETSCDDTGIAILEVSANGSKKNPTFQVLSNIVASQIEVHQKYGGVYPILAKREHQKNIIPTITKALKEAKLLNINKKSPNINIENIKNILTRETDLFKKIIPFLKKYKKPDIDFISITNGPGLEPCLWVGVNFAKCLSYFWNIPLIPTNHVESHILVNILDNPNIKFPAISLVVSGGHTQIILVKKIGKYKILGETRDDAAGECFDKCAKILGLSYPGGPIISKLAENAKTKTLLPRPMFNTKDYDFSFSGLKTSVLYANRETKIKNKKYKEEMSAGVQQAIIDVLIKKTIKAAKDFDVKSLILGGGVSANTELRKQFQGKLPKNIEFIVPRPDLSTDNGLMTAITGFYHKKNIKNWKKIKADGNLRIG
ncbi:MAG: tRNA (adenosine(37)-N6)-threonylcarbamoyltransferase complex transferase subunit TsaD [Candidatus Staskawiczbacteria bacterium]